MKSQIPGEEDVDKLAENIIVDIIRYRMDMPKDNVWVRDQNRKIPENKSLYIIVGMVSEEVFSNTNETFEFPIPNTDPVKYGMKEVGKVITKQMIQIDVLSRSTDAIKRRWEILTAINSVYAQQKQEQYCFRLFQVPQSFVNSSSAEGGSNVNRFSITVVCHVWYRKENTLSGYDYYDDFNTRVDDEKSIETDTGIIEFEIKDNQIL